MSPDSTPSQATSSWIVRTSIFLKTVESAVRSPAKDVVYGGSRLHLTKGNLTLTPNLLLPSLQQALAAELGQLAAAGMIPAGYTLKVPAFSETHTIAAGPELVYRHMKHVTLFFRPVYLGMIHESSSPRPVDPIQTLVVGGFEQAGLLSPNGTKTDNVVFYGFGGGFDVLFNRTFGWRTQSDLVYDHLFSDLLKDGRFTVRFSTGPCFNFGNNIKK